MILLTFSAYIYNFIFAVFYLSPQLRYKYSRFWNQMAAVLQLFYWFQFRPYCRQQHITWFCIGHTNFYPIFQDGTDNIQVMVIVWSLRGNIISTAVCWIVWHNVHSQQHTLMNSFTAPTDWVCLIGTLALCVEAVAKSCIIVTWWSGSELLVGFKSDLDDQLVSFSALALLVWSSGL